MRSRGLAFTLAVIALVSLALCWPSARAQVIDPGVIQLINVLNSVLPRTVQPTAAGAWTPFLDANQGTTVVTVKGSAGALGAYHCLNPNASAAYLQIFDAATSGAVTLGSTVPVLSLGLPASDGGNLEWSMGVHFASGIQVAATTTAKGSTALGTNLDCNLAYK